MALPKHSFLSDLASGTLGIRATMWRDKPGTFAKRPQRRPPPATVRRREITSANGYLFDLFDTLSVSEQQSWETYAKYHRSSERGSTYRLSGRLLFLSLNYLPYDDQRVWYRLPPWLEKPPLLSHLFVERDVHGGASLAWAWAGGGSGDDVRLDVWLSPPLLSPRTSLSTASMHHELYLAGDAYPYLLGLPLLEARYIILCRGIGIRGTTSSIWLRIDLDAM